MGNEYNSDAGSWDDESFEEWLREFAEARNHSKEELIQELSSSLWVLDELESILSEAKVHSTGAKPTPDPTHQAQSSENARTRDDAITAIEDDLETFHEQLVALKEELEETRTETGEDIESVEEILRYLVNQTDSLYERVSRLESTVESNTETIESRQRSRSTLEDLKNTALQEGISSAACEQCGTSIELGLLTHPECPGCGAGFKTLTPKSWFFGTNELTTTPTSPHRRHEQPSNAQSAPNFEAAFNPETTAESKQAVDEPDPPSKEMMSEFGFNLDPKPTDANADEEFERSEFNFSADSPAVDSDDGDADDDSFTWKSG